MVKVLTGHTIGPTTLGIKPKRVFDPKSRDDLLEYKHFITKGNWKHGSCPFVLQWPHVSIPYMLHEIIARYYVTKQLTK
jgi:hypothetical protein